MTKNMYEIQEKLREYNDVLLLSHTVMPEIDTVNQLKKYSVENNVDDKKWNLVTGDKEQIYDLARKSYLAAEDTEFSKFDLIHTENFVLVDYPEKDHTEVLFIKKNYYNQIKYLKKNG